ncbi:glycosyltransferase [Chloroflexia bacterium SDU3-3]|nr:glycosyltransferase [Chloroflexia bacterium SDU3-3]
MTTLLLILLLIAEAACALIVDYLLMLTIAACFAARTTALARVQGQRRFLILVPAHNEEQLLPSTLENLRALDYPKDRYAVHVVADNCSDATAQVARDGGAVVHERFDDTLVGKGYALQWLLQRLWDAGEPHDAIVIMDADSILSANFLAVMNARLARGQQAIQAYYAVRDPEQSWSASLRSVALAALHYLRPQGRMVLGGSTGLKGNGMVFAADVARQHPWPASLTEDIEYHMALILSGQRVAFAPDAVVWAEMPSTLAASRSQNARWEAGRVEMVRRYVPQLLRESLRRRSFMLFDAAVEQLIPPFSLVGAAAVACLIAAALLQSALAIGVAAALVLGIAIYVFAGLLLARMPLRVYQALLYAPFFIIWKVYVYIRVLVGAERRGWVRTARNDP